ncbi:MAG TPA: hypothetical protein VG099_16145 [Gemmataceae bacterium]|jgi:hypothetical protein|nr:hypothetical protein [Gemmataceae bacterium]
MDQNRACTHGVYYWRPEIRGLLCLIWAALAAFFLFGLLAGIRYQVDHPESRMSPLGQFFCFAFLAILDVFLLLSAVATVRAGRLVLDSDKAHLPRIPLGPWGLLKAHALPYAEVHRYGLGIIWQRGQPFSPVLLFELKAGAGAVRGKRRRLGLRWYDDAAYQAIVKEIASRIGYEPEVLANNGVGDVQFEQPGVSGCGPPLAHGGGSKDVEVCSICGARLGRNETTGRCGSCQRKAANG